MSFAPLAFKLFYAARQNAVLRRSPFPAPEKRFSRSQRSDEHLFKTIRADPAAKLPPTLGPSQLIARSPNHQTKKKSSRSFRFRLQITDERVRVMSKNRCFAKQKRRFWSHHSAGHQSFSLYIFRRSAIAARPAICKSSNKQSTRNTTDELRRATEVTVRPPRRRPDAPARASARTAA